MHSSGETFLLSILLSRCPIPTQASDEELINCSSPRDVCRRSVGGCWISRGDPDGDGVDAHLTRLWSGRQMSSTLLPSSLVWLQWKRGFFFPVSSMGNTTGGEVLQVVWSRGLRDGTDTSEHMDTCVKYRRCADRQTDTPMSQRETPQLQHKRSHFLQGEKCLHKRKTICPQRNNGGWRSPAK